MDESVIKELEGKYGEEGSEGTTKGLDKLQQSVGNGRLSFVSL